MYIANVIDDYDNITPSNCTDNEHIIVKTITTLLFTIPCRLSFLCMLSLMIYILIKPLITKKR